MKNLIIRLNSTSHSGMAVCLEYTLFSTHTERDTESYGVAIKNEITRETASISDITENLQTSELLFDRLLSGCVTPVSLKEVVEDFVAEI